MPLFRNVLVILSAMVGGAVSGLVSSGIGIVAVGVVRIRREDVYRGVVEPHMPALAHALLIVPTLIAVLVALEFYRLGSRPQVRLRKHLFAAAMGVGYLCLLASMLHVWVARSLLLLVLDVVAVVTGALLLARYR